VIVAFQEVTRVAIARHWNLTVWGSEQHKTTALDTTTWYRTRPYQSQPETVSCENF